MVLSLMRSILVPVVIMDLTLDSGMTHVVVLALLVITVPHQVQMPLLSLVEILLYIVLLVLRILSLFLLDGVQVQLTRILKLEVKYSILILFISV